MKYRVHCPKCDAPAVFRRQVPGQEVDQPIPKAGDVTICSSCACVSVVEADFSRREITAAEIQAMDARCRQTLSLALLAVHIEIAAGKKP